MRLAGPRLGPWLGLGLELRLGLRLELGLPHGEPLLSRLPPLPAPALWRLSLRLLLRPRAASPPALPSPPGRSRLERARSRASRGGSAARTYDDTSRSEMRPSPSLSSVATAMRQASDASAYRNAATSSALAAATSATAAAATAAERRAAAAPGAAMTVSRAGAMSAKQVMVKA